MADRKCKSYRNTTSRSLTKWFGWARGHEAGQMELFRSVIKTTDIYKNKSHGSNWVAMQFSKC